MLYEYNGSDLQVKLLGKALQGVKELKVEPKQDSEFFYGNGSYLPRSYSRKNIESSGTLTVLGSELFGLIKGVPKGNLLLTSPIDMVCTFINKEVAGFFTMTIKNLLFDSVPIGVKTGEVVGDVALTFKCQEIIYQ